jgi:hypothetical protein
MLKTFDVGSLVVTRVQIPRRQHHGFALVGCVPLSQLNSFSFDRYWTSGGYGHMTETIKVEVDEALARKFRKKAMEKYGYKKGTIKKALEGVLEKFSTTGQVDWASLRGTLKVARNVSSVELQHKLWSSQD